MNITLKKTLNEFLQFLTQSNILIFLIFLFLQSKVAAQIHDLGTTNFVLSYSIKEEIKKESYPDPKAVMRKSMLVPGWGQVANKQAWKIPIVYGLIGGLTYYSITLTKDYHDYRAAYYNLTSEIDDLKFGATPTYLADATSGNLLDQRNFLRNRRDFIYVTIALAYILNFIDAYVFAHLRPFDVSDDLSLESSMEPSTTELPYMVSIPTVSLKIALITR